MKQRLTHISSRLFMVCWMFALCTNLYASTLIDGLYYDLDSQKRTATLTGYTSGLTNVKIPAQVTDGGITYSVVTLS